MEKLANPICEVVNILHVSSLLTVEDFSRLLIALRSSGYRLLGPVPRDGTISYAEITSVDDLPRGVVDVQGPGSYRLVEGGDGFFDALPGDATWKQALFPAHEPLWEATTIEGVLTFREVLPTDTKAALIGARACELAAIAIQDSVFIGGVTEPRYARRRNDVFIVAVECGRAASTCFCASLGTGPRIDPGSNADVILTELPEVGFIARGESERGRSLLSDLGVRAATVPEMEAAVDRVAATAGSITRHLDTEGLREALRSAAASPVWNDLKKRCLACGNCTAVCPTCFCSSAVDTAALDGSTAARERVWASCFTHDYSYMASHTVRMSVGARYRHWITHKFSTWYDQFGISGCVGCGRCITWCPVGIDIVAEAARIWEEVSA